MESYKIDPGKGERIIVCADPRFVFINGVARSGKSQFAARFREHGYDVVAFYKPPSPDAARAVCRRSCHAVVEGFVPDYETVARFFEGEPFTYVWMYPNDPRAYLARGGDVAKLRENKELYAAHIEETGGRMFTILN